METQVHDDMIIADDIMATQRETVLAELNEITHATKRALAEAGIDFTPMRQSRILYPILSWSVSGGDPRRLLWAMPLVTSTTASLSSNTSSTDSARNGASSGCSRRNRSLATGSCSLTRALLATSSLAMSRPDGLEFCFIVDTRNFGGDDAIAQTMKAINTALDTAELA